MKKILLLSVIIALGALGAWVFHAQQSSETPAAVSASAAPASSNHEPTPPAAAPKPSKPAPAAQQIPPTVKAEPEADEFMALGKTILSAQASFDEKNAAWDQLRNTGQLDRAIAELEKMSAAEPDAPETLVALGRAYMYKSVTVQDIAQVGMLGMKMEQSFNAALKLEPANWDAQYYKAIVLSNFPPFMNKGPEMMKTYLGLIQQQEKMPPRPEFANTYLRLGDQYQKQGDGDRARQVWQRGAELFPASQDLQKKANSAPATN